ncbi:MAG TPA: SIS domain-containing protein [Terriglobales bacterium]|nr:SIS domain-containing protein [Terriglobales bacterium]
MSGCETDRLEIRTSIAYFQRLTRIMGELPHRVVEEIADVLVAAWLKQRSVFLFGNGGSAALASHFACDLGKGTAPVLNGTPRMRVLALTDNVSLMTAWANDTHYEQIFAEQLRNFVQREDVAFAISGSGNSPNILRALEVARAAGATTLGLTGFHGGRMASLCDHCLIVPSDNMQHIEDLHLCVAHAIFTLVRYRMAQPLAATVSTSF